MQLQEILNTLNNNYKITGDNGLEIKELFLSSKDVQPYSCFFAVRGSSTDGHRFISDAIAHGAICIFCEEIPDSVSTEKVTFVIVPNVAEIIGPIASVFYGEPSKKMKVIGITGTNGKTTVATMAYRMLSGFMRKTGLISTVENIINNETIPSTHTTPDALTIQKLLSQMHIAGCEYVVMEVSSHSVVQKRINGINFTGGIFTNLSHDHLDYHHTIENYAKAKKEFFDILPTDSFVLTNADDEYGNFMVADSKAHVWTYGFNGSPDFSDIIISNLIGRFNQYNMLAVFAIGKLLGFEPENIKKIISSLQAPKGRFELVYNQGGIKCIVDFAHTPDGVQNVLEAVKEILEENGRIITIIGCGGNRDETKRPIMGRISYDLSNIVIFTSDNPRNEDPKKIITEMCQGLDENLPENIHIVIDRRDAIIKAKELATTDDIVMVLGKGHETYQEIKGVKNHFDDHEVVLEIFG